MHSVTPNPAPAFLEEFKTRYRNHIDGQYEWRLSQFDHARLITELAKQFGTPRIPDYAHRERTSGKTEGLCAYCEIGCTVRGTEPTTNEIDHFAPRSGFNGLTFEWDNLMYVCRRCNKVKDDGKFVGSLIGDEDAYVNPRKPGAEKFFSFEEKPNKLVHIIPNPALDIAQGKDKAQRTIDDLGLNAISPRENTNLPRLRWSHLHRWKSVADILQDDLAKFERLVRRAANRRSQFSSLIIWALDSGYFS